MKFILQHSDVGPGESAALYCLTGKWLVETRSDRYSKLFQNCQMFSGRAWNDAVFFISSWLHALSVKYSFRVILDLYLRKSVEVVESAVKGVDRSAAIYVRWVQRLCRTHYRLAHYTDSLYKSYEDRLISSEWQAALRLRQHKVDRTCQVFHFWASGGRFWKTNANAAGSVGSVVRCGLLKTSSQCSVICSLRSSMPWRNVWAVRRWAIRRYYINVIKYWISWSELSDQKLRFYAM